MVLIKADPFTFCPEHPPATASRVWQSAYAWGDADWMARRAGLAAAREAMSIYEVHLGSWRRPPDGRLPTYREFAPLLADYVAAMGFTHVELMPLTEHPFTARGATSARPTSRPRRATVAPTT